MARYRHRQLCKTETKSKGLHSCREFSQPLKCFYQAMQTQENKSREGGGSSVFEPLVRGGSCNF